MLLKDVMTPTVQTVPSTATVREAARIMADENVGFLPVIHEGTVCTGVVTDRDIVVRAVAAGSDPSSTIVAQVMTSSTRSPTMETDLNARIASLPEDTPVEEAVQFMDERNIRRVAVCDSEYRIVGVASRSDLLNCGTAESGGAVWEPF